MINYPYHFKRVLDMLIDDESDAGAEPAALAVASAPKPTFSREPASSTDVILSDDAYHFSQYLGHEQRAWYIEWSYFNFIDPVTNVAGMATFAVFNPDSRGITGVASLTAAVIAPGHTTPVIDYHPIEVFSGSADRPDMQLAQSTLTVEDDQTYHIHIVSKDGNVTMDLTYVQADIPQFFVHEQHGTYWNMTSWLNYMPSAWVNGTVTVNGESFPITNATGYHDHDWGMWKVHRETWNWADAASPKDEFVFHAVFHAAFQKSTSYVRCRDLRVYFPQSNFHNAQENWVTWRDHWQYPTLMTFACEDESGRYKVEMRWEVIDTLPLWQYPVIVFEQTAQFDGGIYERDSAGEWQLLGDIHTIGFCEHSATWLPDQDSRVEYDG
jgi:hypothetical protein